MLKIYVITGNNNKFKEIKDYFSLDPIKCIQLKYDLPEIQSMSIQEVVYNKYLYAQNIEYIKTIVNQENCYCLVEDTGLYLEEMNGLFGPLIKFVYKAIGNIELYNIFKMYSNPDTKLFMKTGMILFNRTQYHYCDKVMEYHLRDPKNCNNCNKFGFDCLLSLDNTTSLCDNTTVKNENSSRIQCLAQHKKYLLPNA